MHVRFSFNGAIAGAIAGGILRVIALKVYSIVENVEGITLVTPLSFIMGSLLGALAGAFGRPWIGFLVGGFISFFLCGVMVVPFDKLAQAMPGLITLLALSAGLAGAIGGAIGQRLDIKIQKTLPDDAQTRSNHLDNE